MRRISLFCATCALIVCGWSDAFAQNASEPISEMQEDEALAFVLEEVVVTAEKLSSTVQKTPGAVVSQSGDDLIRKSITDITSLDKAIPGFQSIATPIVGSMIVFLRGVGQPVPGDNTQPGVAFNFDGVYVPRQLTHAAFFDIARMEALPGPQGTLYGRNAAGGIINVTVAKPTDRLEGSLLFQGGNFSDIHATGVLNVPVSDTLALRGAVDYHKNDGYLSNGTNDVDSTSGRLSMLLEPNDAFSLTVSASAFRNAGKGSSTVIVNGVPGFSLYTPDPSDPWFDPDATPGLFRDFRGQFVTADMTYDFGAMTLTYLAGYSHYDHDTFYQLGSLHTRTPSKGHFLSHELRLASDTDGRAKWLGGLFWYDGSSSQRGSIALPAVPPILPARTITSEVNIDELESYAAFGQYTYSLTDRVRLTAGGRYSMDKIAGRGSQTLRLLDGTVLGAPDLFGAPMDDDRFDWKVGIETDVSQKSLLYANVQTGYLQGGFTPPPSDMITTFEPAKLLAFNLGAKNRFLGDRLQINDEFFFYDYDDYQITFTRPPAAAITINAAKAEIYGNQLDIDFLPARGTELFLNATWLHAEYTKFVDPLPPFQNLEGFQLQLSPTLSGTAGLQQQWWLGRGGVLAARAEVYYNDGFWGTYNHVPNTYQSSYTRTDVTLTYTTDDEKWSVSAYVNNIEDEAVYPNLTAAGTGEILSTISLPRTYGVRMAVRFSE